MKITSNERYIHAVLTSLDKFVLPELNTTASRESANLIRVVLEYVLKRTAGGVRVLKSVIEDGEGLLNQICDQFPESCKRHASQARQDAADFDSLSEAHGNLVQELDFVCNRLSKKEGNQPKAASLLRRAAKWEYEYLDKFRKLELDRPSDQSNGIHKPNPVLPKPLTKELLEEFLNSRRGPLRIKAFTPVDGGYSNQTYFCTTEDEKAEAKQLVVRKSIPTVIAPFLDLHEEFELLRILHAAGFPAPEPLDLGFKLDVVDDTFYTMKRIPGRPPGTLFMHDDQVVSPRLVQHLAELLAQLHAIPLEKFVIFYQSRGSGDVSHETVEQCYHRKLWELRGHLAKHAHLPSPSITWLFNWLENNIPQDSRLAVFTHGDFDLRNVLAAEDNTVTGVVDWETADLGTPEEDLSYLKAHLPASVDWSLFLAHYYASGGRQIRPEHMRFCQVWSVLRMQVAMNRKVYDLQTGLASDILYFHIQSRFAPGMLEIGLGCVPEDEAGAQMLVNQQTRSLEGKVKA